MIILTKFVKKFGHTSELAYENFNFLFVSFVTLTWIAEKNISILTVHIIVH